MKDFRSIYSKKRFRGTETSTFNWTGKGMDLEVGEDIILWEVKLLPVEGKLGPLKFNSYLPDKCSWNENWRWRLYRNRRHYMCFKKWLELTFEDFWIRKGKIAIPYRWTRGTLVFSVIIKVLIKEDNSPFWSEYSLMKQRREANSVSIK